MNRIHSDHREMDQYSVQLVNDYVVCFLSCATFVLILDRTAQILSVVVKNRLRFTLPGVP